MGRELGRGVAGLCLATDARRRRRAASVPRSRWIKPASPCGTRGFPVAKSKREAGMAKIDLDSLSIEELAALRDSATDKLMEKVAARRAELETEMGKLGQEDR